MQSHSIPDRPWSKAGTNCLFVQSTRPRTQTTHAVTQHPGLTLEQGRDKLVICLHSNHYFVFVDYYSDFVEVSQLDDTTSATVRDFLKEQFSRNGIPDTLVSDNGPQFTSREFTDFSREWKFKHLTSSPYHARSNGKAESAVKIVKNIFKKAISNDKYPWLALLDYRNTPTEGVS